jgi:hypothetical protein
LVIGIAMATGIFGGHIPAVDDAIDHEAVTRAAADRDRCELRRAHTVGFRPDMAQRAKCELDHRLFPEPIGRNHRRQHAERANAGVPDMGKRQQQDFQISVGAVGGAGGNAGDRAQHFVVDDGEQGFDPVAAVLSPELGKGFAFDLAAEQRADARAGQAEAQFIDEIRRQHEDIAECIADCGRIDVGALGGRTVPSLLVPISVQRACRRMFHGRHLFRRETAPASCCPRSGQTRRLIAATSQAEQGACRERRRAAGHAN